MDENFMPIQHIDKFSICSMKKVFVYKTYGQVVYMLHGQVVYICQIEKYISDDMEQVHNKYIDITYFRKRYMNIAPTGNNLSFT